MPFALYLAIRGQITPSLPLFYVRMGAAMHALEDGFPHTYRTADGMPVTVVLNWIDFVTAPTTRRATAHRIAPSSITAGTDDPTIQRNYGSRRRPRPSC